MPSAYDSELAKKLNLKSGMKVRVVSRPVDVGLSGLATTDSETTDGLIVFVRTNAEAAAQASAVVDATRAGKIVWMAYPKARQLNTDLNRDILWRQMQGQGIEAVRQVAIDDTWSAIRFRAGD